MLEFSTLSSLNSLITGQFSREERLNSSSFFSQTSISYIVIGLGGIGSHVAEILGSLKRTKNLYLFDDDDVELSNLNRTAFLYEDIGNSKVESMAKNITNRNVAVNIFPIHQKFTLDNITNIIANEDKSQISIFDQITYKTVYVFDCRDDYYEDTEAIINKLRVDLGSNFTVFRGAYNGYSVTIDCYPLGKKIFGPPGYTVVPSHSIPSRFIAILMIIFSIIQYGAKSRTYSFNEEFDECIIKCLETNTFTFNCYNLIKYMYYGDILEKMKVDSPDAFNHIIRKMSEYTDANVVNETQDLP